MRNFCRSQNISEAIRSPCQLGRTGAAAAATFWGSPTDWLPAAPSHPGTECCLGCESSMGTSDGTAAALVVWGPVGAWLPTVPPNWQGTELTVAGVIIAVGASAGRAAAAAAAFWGPQTGLAASRPVPTGRRLAY